MPLKEPVGLVGVAFEGDLVGDGRLDGRVRLGVGEDPPAPGVFVGSNGLALDDFGSAVGPAAEVAQLFGGVLNLLVEGALLLDLDEVLGPAHLGLEADLAQPHQVLYVVQNLVGGGDLFGELALVQHALASEQREHQHFSQQRRASVHLYRVQRVEELDAVELKD